MTMIVNKRPASFKEATTAAEVATDPEAGVLSFNFETRTVQLSASIGTDIVQIPVGASVYKIDTTATGTELVASQTRDTTAAVPLNGIAGVDTWNLPNNAPTTPHTFVPAVKFTWTLTSVLAGAENSTAHWDFLIGGAPTQALEFSDPGVDDQSVGVLTFRQGGVYVTKRVKQGAANSGPGGVGRALYVDN